MSKIGNHVAGMQESEDFQLGWLSAERGEPKPIWACCNIAEMDRLQAQQFGWHSFHTETGSYGSPEGVQSWPSYGLHGEN